MKKIFLSLVAMICAGVLLSQSVLAIEYAVEVTNGNAPGLIINSNGDFVASVGDVVTIHADAPPIANGIFDRWVVTQGSGVIFDNEDALMTTFKMPAEDVKISATYYPDPAIVGRVVMEGADQTYTIGSGTDVSIKINGKLSEVGKITVDGVDLDAVDYDLAKGSTILTLKSAYLNTLTPGTYTVSVAYTAYGAATTTFTIAAAPVSPVNPVTPVVPKAPNTGRK